MKKVSIYESSVRHDGIVVRTYRCIAFVEDNMVVKVNRDLGGFKRFRIVEKKTNRTIETIPFEKFIKGLKRNKLALV